MAQLMPLPLTVSCFIKIQICFTFLVPAHLGSPGQRAVKWVHVCVVERINILGWIYKLPDSHQHHKTLVSCILTVSNQFLTKENISSTITSITYLELVKEEAELTCLPSACSKQKSDHSVYRRTDQSKGSPTSHNISVSTQEQVTHTFLHTYRVPGLLDEKIPGVFQHRFSTFQVLWVILCNRTSNAPGQQ